MGEFQSTGPVVHTQLLRRPAFSPEFRLAAACAIWPHSDRRTEAIRAAASEPLDWARFLRVAKRHQVIGLVHEGLTQALPGIALEITNEIRTQAMALVREGLAIAHEAMRIQYLFDESDLPVVFVKGPALAVLAFGNLGLRSSQDIDVLIPYETLPDAIALILRAGYCRFDPPANISDAKLQLLMPLRKDLGFVHPATGRRIELHWRLFLNPHAMDESSFMAASRIVPLSRAATLRSLGEDDLFAYLCMHGALHWWNRLKWLADVNALLAAAPVGRVERLVQAAEAKGVERAAAQALLLCHRLFGTHFPIKLMATLKQRYNIRWLAATALNAMSKGEGEHDPHQVRFGTTRGSLSTFLLKSSLNYRLAELRVQLINPTDVQILPLPQPLRFLYPALRLPLWLWRHVFQRTILRQTTPTS